MDGLQAHMRRRGIAPQGMTQEADDDAQHDTANLSNSFWQALQSVGPVALLIDDLSAVCACLCFVGAIALCAPFIVLGSGVLGAWLIWRVLPSRWDKVGRRVVCISDTHGRHREVVLPPGDVLIHAGDFTKFGKREDAEDFNDWLAEQAFTTKIVVNGNHENNAEWQKEVKSILTNATFLKDSGTQACGLDIYGTDFCWPMKEESVQYGRIPRNADVVVAHGPAHGFVDGRTGCRALLWAIGRIRPRLVVSGHIHYAHGVQRGIGALRGTTFVNAANCCGSGYKIGWEPVVIDL